MPRWPFKKKDKQDDNNSSEDEKELNDEKKRGREQKEEEEEESPGTLTSLANPDVHGRRGHGRSVSMRPGNLRNSREEKGKKDTKKKYNNNNNKKESKQKKIKKVKSSESLPYITDDDNDNEKKKKGESDIKLRKRTKKIEVSKVSERKKNPTFKKRPKSTKSKNSSKSKKADKKSSSSSSSPLPTPTISVDDVDSDKILKEQLKTELKEGVHALRKGSLNNMPRLKLGRFFILPGAFALFMWILAVAPTYVLMALSFSTIFQCRSAEELTLEESLPPHPSSLYQSWELGKLAERLHLATNPPYPQKAELPMSDIEIEQLLANATEIVGRKANLQITKEQLLAIEDLLSDLDKEQGYIMAIFGLFSFVNLLWLIGVLGVTATVGPVTYLLFKPLIPPFMNLMYAIFNKAVVPLAIACLPILEGIGYFLCCCLVVKGAHCPEETYGFMLAIMGIFFIVPLLFYSVWLHGITMKHLSLLYIKNPNTLSTSVRKTQKMEASNLLFSIYATLVCVPAAIFFQSSLLGFIATFCVYSALGFSSGATGWCHYAGFKNEDAMERCTLTSVLLIVIFIILRFLRLMSGAYVQPFALGVLVFGSISYFLGLMIVCNLCYLQSKYGKANAQDIYFTRNAFMLGSLLVALLLGHTLHLHAIINTTYTFFVLWVMEKMAEKRIYPKNIFVLIFFSSIGLIFLGMTLNRHPGIILGMFDTSSMI